MGVEVVDSCLDAIGNVLLRPDLWKVLLHESIILFQDSGSWFVKLLHAKLFCVFMLQKVQPVHKYLTILL